MNTKAIVEISKKQGYNITRKTEEKVIIVSQDGKKSYTILKKTYKTEQALKQAIGRGGYAKDKTVPVPAASKKEADSTTSNAPVPPTFAEVLDGISGVGPITVAKILAVYTTEADLKAALVAGTDIDGVSATIETKLKAHFGI